MSRATVPVPNQEGLGEMRVGVPREVKNHEYRVAVTPAGVNEFVRHGHEVRVERDAGAGSGIRDEEYRAAGATIQDEAEKIWADSDMVLKIKEPVPSEYHLLGEGQVLFTYLHLAASRSCTEALLNRRVTSIAYETVEAADGSLPLLAPMSEVAGRLAPQAGATLLQANQGGRGVLLGGVPGVPPGKVTVLGAGTAGYNAAVVAAGLGADVLLLDRNVDRLRQADRCLPRNVRTLASTAYSVQDAVADADLVIGAVLVTGAKAPVLVSNSLVSQMRPGSVFVDISIDQGGCFEDSRATTYDDPTYLVHQSVFYCVANMPGAVPNTSTYALTNVTLPYALALANHGHDGALARDPSLLAGLNTHDGRLINPQVGEAHGLPVG